MKKFFPVMYDRPEKTMSIAGTFYCIFAFYTLPFLTLFFSQGYADSSALSWFEIIFHSLNFLVTVWIFREYLKESFFNARYNLKPFLIISGSCTAICVIYAACVTFQGVIETPYSSHFIAQAALPLVEVELFNLTSYLIRVNPIAGTICVIFLAPVVISCLYYATVFAPVCNSRPWLAYILVLVVLAIPRICNALTFWPPMEELALYLVQLPLHLIACIAYQKADTVWAPIAVHMSANTIACVMVFLQLGIG